MKRRPPLIDWVFYFMAEDKKKFLAYCDWIETFEALTDEEAGKLIKH